MSSLAQPAPTTAAEMAAAITHRKGFVLDRVTSFGLPYFRPGDLRIEVYGARASGDDLVLHLADRGDPEKRGPDLVVSRPEGFSFVPPTGSWADGFSIARAASVRWGPGDTGDRGPEGAFALDVRWSRS